MKLVSIVIRDANVGMNDLVQFLQETNQSYFLLGKDINEYLTEIYRRGVELHGNEEMLRRGNLPIGEERNQRAARSGELLNWFGDQMLVARTKFSEHLGLDV
jgi:hypothetical protein